MAKDKSLKEESKPSKRKQLHSADSGISEEETIPKREKKRKKKRVEAEEAPVQVPSQEDVVKRKKDKKQIKQQITEQTQISDPPSRPDGTQEIPGEEDLSPEERRVLERKMKKILKKEAKKKLKEEGKTENKTEECGPSASRLALDYLTSWADNRTKWKFQKTRQTWLLQHMFNSEMVPDDKFSVLLEYLDGLRGGARDTTVQKALVLVQESGQSPDDADVQQRAHRAREVIQLLS